MVEDFGGEAHGGTVREQWGRASWTGTDQREHVTGPDQETSPNLCQQCCPGPWKIFNWPWPSLVLLSRRLRPLTAIFGGLVPEASLGEIAPLSPLADPALQGRPW